MGSKRARIQRVLFCGLPYAIGIALAAAGWRRPVLLAGFYLVLIMAMLARWHSRSDVISLVVGALLGPVAELPAILSGAWAYSVSETMIPIWLPLAWGIAGLCIKKTTEAIVGSVQEGTTKNRSGMSQRSLTVDG